MTPNPRERDFWWAVARATLGTLAKTAFRLRVAGAGNVPSGAGALLAYNHLSVIDAVFVALPIVERGRAVHFFALSEDFERPIVGWGLRKTGQIPIRRSHMSPQVRVHRPLRVARLPNRIPPNGLRRGI